MDRPLDRDDLVLARIKDLALQKIEVTRQLREAILPYMQKEYPAYAENRGGWLGWEFVDVDPDARVLKINLVTYDERIPPRRELVTIDCNFDNEEYQLALRLKEKYNL